LGRWSSSCLRKPDISISTSGWLLRYFSLFILVLILKSDNIVCCSSERAPMSYQEQLSRKSSTNLCDEQTVCYAFHDELFATLIRCCNVSLCFIAYIFYMFYVFIPLSFCDLSHQLHLTFSTCLITSLSLVLNFAKMYNLHCFKS
jgi:hypothetical protein